MTNLRIFYKWLAESLVNHDLFTDKTLQNEVTSWLSQLNPALNWEIGPGYSSKYFFAFSPSLDKTLLPTTIRLANQAPVIDDWEFLPAKPRKRWTKRKAFFKLADKEVSINFDLWKYFLEFSNNNDFFDLHIIPTKYETMAVDELEYFANILIEFELGEKLFMDIVDKIHIVSSKSMRVEFCNIDQLYDHIVSEKSRFLP